MSVERSLRCTRSRPCARAAVSAIAAMDELRESRVAAASAGAESTAAVTLPMAVAAVVTAMAAGVVTLSVVRTKRGRGRCSRLHLDAICRFQDIFVSAHDEIRRYLRNHQPMPAFAEKIGGKKSVRRCVHNFSRKLVNSVVCCTTN
eukprot:177140-Pleurochrysis_carterae.AAC.1